MNVADRQDTHAGNRGEMRRRKTDERQLAERLPSKNFLITCTVEARPARPIDVVSVISFGQTATQFCALPQA